MKRDLAGLEDEWRMTGMDRGVEMGGGDGSEKR